MIELYPSSSQQKTVSFFYIYLLRPAIPPSSFRSFQRITTTDKPTIDQNG